MTDLPSTSLRSYVYALVIGILLIAATIFAAFVALKGDRVTDSTMNYATQFRTSAAAQELARSLEQDWRDLIALSEQLDGMEPEQIGHLLTGAVGDGSRISWLGYADLRGEVISANDGLLLGQNVSERPWFQNGLKGGFAGDVHDAVLLARLLATDGEPLRFIDLAQPVTNANGDLIGVLGMHINAVWLGMHLTETANIFGMDFFLLRPDGEISSASTLDTPSGVELQILRAAQTGIRTEGREKWPDGTEYFSSLVPQVTYGSLPDFGWRMVGRLDADSLNFGVDLVQNGALQAVAIGLILICVVTFLFVTFLIAPISRIASLAHRLSEGSQEYPANVRTTHEAALLSTALTRLQQDRVSDDRPVRDVG